MSFCKFAAITTISLPSTNPAPTNSAAIPSAESTPTANSNLISLSSRLWLLNKKKNCLFDITFFMLEKNKVFVRKKVIVIKD